MNRQPNRCFLLCVAVGSIAAEPQPRISVTVFNYSGVSLETLATAEREANDIFRQAGVAIDWTGHPVPSQPCLAAPGPARFEVRLLSRAMIGRLVLKPAEFGRALIDDHGGFGTLADVYSDRIQQLAGARPWAYGPILGHIIAHELGHLLLGRGAHSAGTLMDPGWKPSQLNHALQRRLRFTPSQAENIRAQVLARVAAGPAVICQ